MLDFQFYSPTQVVFGKQSLAQLPNQLQKQGAKHVLLHYGMGSVQKSGLLDKTIALLEQTGVQYTLLGGVRPNPVVSLCREGVALCKAKNIDFILALGGGSVLDSAKAIAVGACIEEDIWDIYQKAIVPQKALPLGCILTLSATGSELSSRSVVSNDESNAKLGIGADAIRPLFAIMNPEHTYSVNPWQTASGTIDILMHTIERYFTKTKNVALVDSMAEALMRNVINAGKIAYQNPEDYEARATLMWAGSLSHNDLLGLGRQQDWACHKLEHEMSAVDTTITHGAGLAVLFPHWAKYVMHEDLDRFIRFAKEVFGIQGDGFNKEQWALAGIAAFVNYAQSLGMPSNMRYFGLTEEDCYTMAKRCADYYKTIGAFKVLQYEDMLQIYKNAL
ncbi:MAG: iron-containing alcohol dehydrogenase [Eubacteriales bacterium]|nr:iron-containing alcohol dehydrogenase [Eubacteriales bacterium]